MPLWVSKSILNHILSKFKGELKNQEILTEVKISESPSKDQNTPTKSSELGLKSYLVKLLHTVVSLLGVKGYLLHYDQIEVNFSLTHRICLNPTPSVPSQRPSSTLYSPRSESYSV